MPSDLFAEVKAAYDIVEVAQALVPDLKQKGSYRWEGRCPFHEDSTPSFSVYVREQRFKCYGCEAKGDVIELWQRGHHLKQPYEAVRAMAEAKNIQLPTRKSKGVGTKERLYGVLAKITDYWHEQLLPELRAHLRDHYGLTDETINFWNIGYSGGDLFAHLKEKGIDLKVAKETGLVTEDKRGQPFVLLRKRIIFPFLRDGLPVYTSGRTVQGFGEYDTELSPEAKYLHQNIRSDDKKYISVHIQKPLWGGDNIKGARNLLVVEGFTDAMLLWQEREALGPGWAIIALAGKKMTEKQANFIAESMEDQVVYLCPDSDAEGIKGGVSCGLDLFQRGTEVKVVQLGQSDTDPNEYIQAKGIETLLSDIEKARPFHLFWLQRGMFEADKESFWRTTYLPEVTRRDEAWLDAQSKSIAELWGITAEQLGRELKAAAKAATDQNVRNMDELLRKVYIPVAIERTDSDCTLTLWSRQRKQVASISLTRTGSLIGMIAPDIDIYSAVRDSSMKIPSSVSLQQIVAQTIYNWVPTLPEKRQYKELRAGLHVVGDKLVLISGDRVLIKDQGHKWRELEEPFVAKRAYVNCTGAIDWCPWSVDELNKPLEYDRQMVYDMLSLAIHEGWDFKHENDAAILAGAAFTFTWASAFPRKPLVHVLGKSGSGKSALIVGMMAGSDYYIGSGGPFVMNSSYEQNMTLASVMSKYEGSGLTMVLDEAETKDESTKHRVNDKLLEVLKILRNAAEFRGKISRGTPSGGYREHEINIGCICGSINIWEAEAEDRRWLMCETAELPDKSAPVRVLREFWRGYDVDEVRRTVLLAFQDDFTELTKTHHDMLHSNIENDGLIGPSQRDNALPILACINMLSSGAEDITQQFFKDKHVYFQRRLGTYPEMRLIELLVNAPIIPTGEPAYNVLHEYTMHAFNPNRTAPHGIVVDDTKLYVNFALAQRDGPLLHSEFERESAKTLVNVISNHPGFLRASEPRQIGGVNVRWVVVDLDKCVLVSEMEGENYE